MPFSMTSDMLLLLVHEFEMSFILYVPCREYGNRNVKYGDENTRVHLEHSVLGRVVDIWSQAL